MPEMDDHETSQQIRQGKAGDRHCNIPTIALADITKSTNQVNISE